MISRDLIGHRHRSCLHPPRHKNEGNQESGDRSFNVVAIARAGVSAAVASVQNTDVFHFRRRVCGIILRDEG